MLLEHPLLLIPVTVYSVPTCGVTIFVAPIILLLQTYTPAPATDKVIDSPRHIVELELTMDNIGLKATSTECEAAPKQLLISFTESEYVKFAGGIANIEL